MGHLVAILIASAPSEAPTSVAEVYAVPGRGLTGDRYFESRGTFSPMPMKPDHEVTLIEQENLEAFARTADQPYTAAQARRNLVTAGVRLNDLVNCEFVVGSVRLRGMRLCEPCAHLARISVAEVLPGLVHRGGLRAQILTAGMIHVGDRVENGSP